MFTQKDLSTVRRFMFPTKNNVEFDLITAAGIPIIKKLRQRKQLFFVTIRLEYMTTPLLELIKSFNMTGYRVLGAQYSYARDSVDTVIFTIIPYVHGIWEKPEEVENEKV